MNMCIQVCLCVNMSAFVCVCVCVRACEFGPNEDKGALFWDIDTHRHNTHQHHTEPLLYYSLLLYLAMQPSPP